MTSPFLSIGIPTYKRPHRLKHILTVLTQQVDIAKEDWEIVVSDNCSNDETPEVVKSFSELLPITYFRHDTNTGPDYNFCSLAYFAKGKYLWFVPDDDDLTSNESVARLIHLIKNAPSELSAVFLNYKSVELDTHRVLNENMFEISENILLKKGEEVFDHIDNVHLLTGICLVLKRDLIKNEFVEQYRYIGNLSPMAMSITACAGGPILIVGETLVILGAGDSASWRKYWSSIYLQSIPKLIKHAVSYYGWPESIIRKVIQKHKSEFDNSLTWHYFLFQKYHLKWHLIASIYGWPFTIWCIIISPLKILRNLRISQSILGR